MWIQIEQDEYIRNLADRVNAERRDVSEWCGFDEYEWVNKDTQTPLLRMTIQDRYDEEYEYPPTIRCYKWEK